MDEPIIFSVVITAYNRAWCIERAINSVLNQSVQDIEVVVSDDGSSDNTFNIVNEKYFAHTGKVRCVRSETNKGMFHAQRLGVQSAKGLYVVFLDSDDELSPNALHNFTKCINEHPELNVFFQTFVDEEANIKGQLQNIVPKGGAKIFNYRDMCRLFAIGDYLPCVKVNLFYETDFFEPVCNVSAYTHNLWYNLFAKEDVLFSNSIGGIVHLDHSDRRTKNQSNMAAAWLIGVEYFVSHHGAAIRSNGGQLRKCYLDASRFAFQSGQRSKGISYLIRAIFLEVEFRILKSLNTA
jgi:glycosyltransferase involved in cell wall biosynthesis